MKSMADVWNFEVVGTRKTLLMAWQVFKVLLMATLGLMAFMILYEIIWKVRLQGPSWEMVLLIVPTATYLWWLIAKTLRLLGVRRSATFTLLLSLTLTIWVLVATMHLQMADFAEDASAGLWGWLEKAVLYLVHLVL